MRDRYGVPEIFEDEAYGSLKLLYNDIKFVLKVPIVNFIFRTLAWYDKFLFMAWNDVRNNMLTTNMELAAEKLRYPNISISAPEINWAKYYNYSAIDNIKRIVFTFNYVNTKLLLIASAWTESLGNRPISGNGNIQGDIIPGIIPRLPDIKLIDVNKASEPVQDLLMDIARTHHTYDLASDYRALAYYPDFLSVSWRYLKPYVDTDEYNVINSQLKEKAIELAHTMPFPVTVDRRRLEHVYSEKDIAGIMGIVSMFQNFLPSLIIDGEYFRRMIQ